MHQVRVLVSCIQHGLVICFTLDNIHVNDSILYTLLNFSRFSVISTYHFYEQKKKLVLENFFI